MPAIQPARLKIQAAELSAKATDPEEFCRSLHVFLDFYADRTFRPGQAGEPPPILPAYQVPKPVLRAVEKELSQFAGSDRTAALKLVDELWDVKFMEFKLIAASILGQVNPLPATSIFRRVEAWSGPGTEERLVRALVRDSLVRILTEDQDSYFQKVLSWLRSRKLNFNRIGLKAIPPLLENGRFEDFPPLFKEINRKMRLSGNPLKTEILEVIEVLARRSPDETAFFLSQSMYSAGDNPNITWFIRKSMKFFPPEPSRYLRETLLKGR
ncbi:MAG: DNA alkylation repair protein [Chloroflexota bacterium]|nr:MAG: DNA alkylation repair protein [Chloroflexota bacterium]